MPCHISCKDFTFDLYKVLHRRHESIRSGWTIGSCPNQLFAWTLGGWEQLRWVIKRLILTCRRRDESSSLLLQVYEPFYNSPQLFPTTKSSCKELIWASPYCRDRRNSLVRVRNQHMESGALWVEIEININTWFMSESIPKSIPILQPILNRNQNQYRYLPHLVPFRD